MIYFIQVTNKLKMSSLSQSVEPMPHVASTEQITGLETSDAQAIDNAPVNMSAKNAQSKTYSRRVVLHTTATAADLMAGKAIEIPDAEKIFQPDFNSSEKDMKALLENVDTSKGIITEVQVLSLYSNAPAPVTMGMKMFQRRGSARQATAADLKITNESGWLYSCSKNALGSESSHSRNNFINVLAMQPFERCRIPSGMSVSPNPLFNYPFVKRRKQIH